ncbi:DNA methyltransferase [Polaromonas sp. DSR2-3-2]|uniref:DNA methyltransferase n=1 Tax=unclassified Polaromonas TaxID=2638319 RepID=UPI003CF6625C
MQNAPTQASEVQEATQTTAAQTFIERWQGVTASELSTAQSFVRELCELLGLASPHATLEQDYMFERPITFHHGDGSTSPGRVDCYRRGHFVLEAKKLRAAGHTRGFDDALLRARAQAEGYARALPALEGRPPFLLVVDVGNVIELYSEFSRSGATYTPFPDPRSHRLLLADLRKSDVRDTLRRIWQDPDSLDPSRASARVTRQVAGQLAGLARSLERSGHKPDHVAAFLTRALFSMFAEDVGLLPKGAFLQLLQTHRAQPATLQHMLRVLWADMDTGGFCAALATPVLRFNGKLFKHSSHDSYSLLLNPEQIDGLILAANSNWREVEPAIFGTLLERALDPAERHALGAHYTPRAYVERLVLPTVIEPLRADWANAQAAALVLAHEAAELSGKAADSKLEEARLEVRKFHHQLCDTRVLDPACGSGNFLYVTLEHLKRLEGEVVNQLADLGESQDRLGFEGETVTPRQLLGIELNERAAAMAELVLWIGYLQWHIRTRGNNAVAEPVVHDYGNIAHRDAVLAWQSSELAYGDDGQLVSRWDGQTFKPHPVTGALVPDEAALVPDEAALVPQWKYHQPAQAAWPAADFIVGNPPFIGASTMRAALGDGYVQALRGAWPEVPESADFVMYWWSRASTLLASGAVRRFGLITTNSLR